MMGLLQKAVETYENFNEIAGEPREGHPTLTPVSHIAQKTQIEISLGSDGAFVLAVPVDEKTVIPATEKSAGRVGDNTEAHPLSDQLRYLASFGNAKYEAYVEQLSDWASSPFGHPKLDAVLKYVTGGTIVSDLAGSGLIETDENGVPLEKYQKYVIRWRVLGFGEPTACWEDKELFSLYDRYYRSTVAGGDTELCMISGDMDVPARSNPKGIVAAAYGAKLISANDSAGFTYRGRFTEPREAVTVGYSASQKAHCALQWVTADQGDIIGGRTFVCWNPKGLQVPSPMEPFGKFDDEPPLLTPTEYKKKLWDTISGFKNELPDSEGVVIAAFDAATTGRLSLTYYSEQSASEFMDRMRDWYVSCCWPFGKYGYQSPSIRQIAKCAFGVQREGYIDLDDKVLKEQVQRLLPCVTAGAAVPEDVVRNLAGRASVPQAYSGSPWIQLLCTACAVIRKYHNDKVAREEYLMELEPGKKDRSYQYGRLLAVFEKIERDTYDKNDEREPNAIRMQSVFSERPLYATRIIRERLLPYYQRLKPGQRKFYDKLIEEIFLAMDGEKQDKRLGDTYILGYYLQKNALYTSNKNDVEAETDE